MTLSIFDHKKNKKSSQANNGQSKLGNTIYEIAKEFSSILSTNAKPKSQEVIAKEFLLQTVKQVECQMHLVH